MQPTKYRTRVRIWISAPMFVVGGFLLLFSVFGSIIYSIPGGCYLSYPPQCNRVGSSATDFVSNIGFALFAIALAVAGAILLGVGKLRALSHHDSIPRD